MIRPSSITGSLALVSAGGAIGCVAWRGSVVVVVVVVEDVVVVVENPAYGASDSAPSAVAGDGHVQPQLSGSEGHMISAINR